MGDKLAVLEAEPIDVKQEQQDRLSRMQDEVLDAAHDPVMYAMRYGDLDPAATAPPDEWVVDLGEKEALRRYRLIRAGQAPSSEAPHGLKVATATYISGMRNRSDEKRVPSLKVQFIQLSNQEAPHFPAIRIDDDD